jgi:hypothetical protein
MDVVAQPVPDWSRSTPPAGDRQLRLLLSPSLGRGALDGAWWPYSHDLRAEAVDLAKYFPLSWGRIARLIYSAGDERSDRLKIGNTFVTLASFPHGNTSRALLLTSPSRRVIHLLVVPPEREDRPARHAMRIAATPTNDKSAITILTESDDQLRALDYWPIGMTTADIPHLAKAVPGRHEFPDMTAIRGGSRNASPALKPWPAIAALRHRRSHFHTRTHRPPKDQ